MSITRQRILIALLGVFLGGAIIGVNLFVANRLIGVARGTPYADVFDRLDDPLDIMLALGDGQAFLALARDPSLSNLAQFRFDRGEAALRAQRPVQGYLGWVFSAGHPDWAAEGLLIATALGCGVAALGAGELLRRRGHSPWLGLLVLELPGAIASIRQVGPEVLGLGLVCFALIAKDDERPWLSIALFAVAGLARETYLLIPLLFAWRDKRYLIPHITWLAWTGVVWLRFDAYGPTVNLAGTRLLVPPFVGLSRALPSLQFRPLTALLIVTVPVLVAIVLAKRLRDPLTPIVVAYGLFSLCFDWIVWRWWASFSRPLLPMMTFALIALSSTPSSESRRGRPPVTHAVSSPQPPPVP